MWFDEATVETAVELTPSWVGVVLVFLGYLGSIYVIAPGTAAATLRGTSWKTTTWPGILLAAYATFVSIKAGFFVERPGVDPPVSADVFPFVLTPVYDLAVAFDTGAFPSGHAMAATVFWGLVVFDLDVRTFRQRLALAVPVVAVVGVSRIALGLHYVADVIGGVGLGVLVLAVMLGVRSRASNPANATLGVALIPVLAGFPAGTPLEASALFAALVAVFFLFQYTDAVDEQRLSPDTDQNPDSRVSRQQVEIDSSTNE